jgi:hypothetical protein
MEYTHSPTPSPPLIKTLITSNSITEKMSIKNMVNLEQVYEDKKVQRDNLQK